MRAAEAAWRAKQQRLPIDCNQMVLNNTIVPWFVPWYKPKQKMGSKLKK